MLVAVSYKDNFMKKGNGIENFIANDDLDLIQYFLLAYFSVNMYFHFLGMDRTADPKLSVELLHSPRTTIYIPFFVHLTRSRYNLKTCTVLRI